MIGVVVVTHGQLAAELVNAAEAIVGDLPRFAAVSIGWHDDTDDARDEIMEGLRPCAVAVTRVLFLPIRLDPGQPLRAPRAPAARR